MVGRLFTIAMMCTALLLTMQTNAQQKNKIEAVDSNADNGQTITAAVKAEIEANTDEYLSSLNDANPFIRGKAILSIGPHAWVSDQLRKAVFNGLSDENAHVRSMTALVLAQWPELGETEYAIFLDAADTEFFSVYAYVINAMLTQFERHGLPESQWLKSQYKDHPSEVLELLTSALTYDDLRQPASKVLIELFHENPDSRSKLIWEVQRKEEHAVLLVPGLMDGLKRGYFDGFKARRDLINLYRAIGPGAAEALPWIQQQANSIDQETRVLAWRAMASMGVKAASYIPEMIEALNMQIDEHGWHSTQYELAMSLGAMGDQMRPHLEQLSKGLEHRDSIVRLRTLEVYALLGEVGVSSLPKLLERTRYETNSERETLGEAITVIAKSSAASGPVFVEAMKSEHDPVRVAAAYGLILRGESLEQAYAVFREQTNDSDLLMNRYVYMFMLGKKSEPLLDIWLQALEVPDSPDAGLAVYALREHELKDEWMPALFNMIEEGYENKWVAFELLAKAGEKDDFPMSRLRASLKDEEISGFELIKGVEILRALGVVVPEVYLWLKDWDQPFQGDAYADDPRPEILDYLHAIKSKDQKTVKAMKAALRAESEMSRLVALDYFTNPAFASLLDDQAVIALLADDAFEIQKLGFGLLIHRQAGRDVFELAHQTAMNASSEIERYLDTFIKAVFERDLKAQNAISQKSLSRINLPQDIDVMMLAGAFYISNDPYEWLPAVLTSLMRGNHQPHEIYRLDFIKYAKRLDDPGLNQQIVWALRLCLRDSMSTLKAYALNLLHALGGNARAALPAVQYVAEHDDIDVIRETAMQTMQAILAKPSN